MKRRKVQDRPRSVGQCLLASHAATGQSQIGDSGLRLSTTMKAFFTIFVAPLLVLLTGAAVLWFVALPAEYARRNEQIKVLQKSHAELKAQMEAALSQARNNKESIVSNSKDIARINSAVNNFSSTNAALEQRITATELSLHDISSVNPMVSECAEIMRQMRQPGQGMTVMTLDKETNTLRNTLHDELSERYNQLGCNNFQQ